MESRRGRYIEYFGDWQSQRRNNMNYPVLEIFDVVELRDGRLAVVLPVSEELDEKGLGLYSRAYTYIPRIVYAVNYNDDLTYNTEDENLSDADIMKVLKYRIISSHEAYMRLITDIVIRRGSNWDDFKTFNMKDRLKPFGWTWEREEVKEVTMDDIEKQFGCKIKIVKEADDGT